MANRILFDPQGHYLLGKHKGVHASKLDLHFVQWASTNVDGFKEQYGILARGESLPAPKRVEVKSFSQERPKRQYFISKVKRHYEP